MFDVLVALLGLLLTLPLVIPILVLIWINDLHAPFYISERIGRAGRTFRMVKIRSMVVNADKSGVYSTSSGDSRITSIGRVIRKSKLDEICQLWNVLTGDMSLVGPRPNVKRETDLYTEIEKRLLKVRPGMTDLASVVFADEGDILRESADPDVDYNQLIRPWKSRLGLLYVEHQSTLLDLKILALTLVSFISRSYALHRIQNILLTMEASHELRLVASRKESLYPCPPPGAL